MDIFINWLYKKLEPIIDGHITGRIVTFHRALVQRGQINKPLKQPDTPELFVIHYKQDHNYQ